ncbi:hypothetical protein BWI96_12040 [Siphonobacter sp. SORGH_AS_0500]|uniref:carboxypeptidase-like regulatory domain-containing protein n=1 Tax=Siphonobacter sp. SORGH_AS_0500 TaxID=1864824 RepID=UPI000CAAE659|nr:carboxypeptidase-like regulatory domain-containing protein [Siphonobacter sp. SORGH_AS_0500]PKK36143.1 hypothetical protein BWI96_12040 [Siphonobacter sp. SORGH_AS_0500]
MKHICFAFFLYLLTLVSQRCLGQDLLSKTVSISAQQQRLAQVLQRVGQQGGFSFSYNSHLFNQDSLVSIRVHRQTVNYVLHQLLGDRFLYKQTGNYLIIQLNITEKFYNVSGTILDQETGEKVELASIYDKTRLLATSSNDQGHFRLRLKAQKTTPLFTVSRLGYHDTTLVIPPDENVNIRIKPKSVYLQEVTVNQHSGGENSWLGRRLLSRRLRSQSQNLSQFFVNLPYQVALTPGLSSRGRLSTQIVNTVSINLLGGYNAGVNGVEVAGVFNITKNNVRSLQVAGLFNLVGGSVRGVQIAGLHNNIMDTLKGLQLSGVHNFSQRNLGALQLAGVMNVTRQAEHSLQIAGLSNHIKRGSSVLQIAGLFNSHSGENARIQIAGLYNYAHHLKGFQIGIINQADSSSGASIGLVNLTKNGKKTFSLSANELVPLQLEFKSGTPHFYTVLIAGYSPAYQRKLFTFGLGIGSEFTLSDHFDFAVEFSSQSTYQGSWSQLGNLYRLQPILRWKKTKHLAFITGPTASLYHSGQTVFAAPYLADPAQHLPSAKVGMGRVWLGGQFAVEFSW